MKIGIDISQVIYEGTGVAEYTKKLVEELVRSDSSNEYILFFSHFNAKITQYESHITKIARANVTFKKYKIPVQVLEFVWNKLHILPVERLIGGVDVFLSSDWLEPPTKKAKKVTTIHDLSIMKTPETFDGKIARVHKRKLNIAVKECDAVLCDSKATKQDAIDILGIKRDKLHVVYLGL